MPSTYSTSLRLELIGNGEQAANWGNTTNTNLGTLLEQAITGVATVTMGDANYTLVTGNGISDEARNAVVVMAGTLTATRNVVVPTANKFYAVRNATTGGQSILVKTSAGTGVTLANGFTQLMYCDGTNVVAASVPYNPTTGSIGDITATSAVISGSSSGDLVRITQTGTGNALVVEDSANPDATPFVIDSTGRLVAGYTASITISSASYLGYFLGAGVNYPLGLGYTSASSVGPRMVLAKNRSADWSTQTVVQVGDILGEIDFAGSDGTNIISGARVQSLVETTPGTNDMPGCLLFSTTADGSSTPSEKVRITSDGKVGIGTQAPSRLLSVVSTTATTNAVTQVLRVDSQSSATPAVGIGAGIEFAAETAASNTEVGATIEAVTTDVTPASEDFDLTFSTMQNGAAATEKMRITSGGNIGIGISAPVYSMQLNGASKNFGVTGTGNPSVEVVSSDAAGIPFLGVVNGTRNWTFRTEGSSGALTTRDNTAVAERMRIDTSGNLYFDSGYGSAAVAYGCRAWVNFNGSPSTGTYSRATNVITVTLTSHGMTTGQSASFTFAAGTGGTATSGNYIVTVVDANTLTMTDSSGSGTITGSPSATRNTWIKGSGNVSSITDNGTGDYTVNFTTAMPDANYAAVTGWSTGSPASSFDSSCSIYSAASVTTSSVRIFTSRGDLPNQGEDSDYVAVAIFR